MDATPVLYLYDAQPLWESSDQNPITQNIETWSCSNLKSNHLPQVGIVFHMCKTDIILVQCNLKKLKREESIGVFLKTLGMS